MYSPVSPQVGHETSVSKQVNWNTWAVIQDCSIPSATRSAAPIISIFFLEGHPTTFGSHSVSSRSFTLTFDWAGQICWQIINKMEIECSALWEGRVQPSVAGVLVLISDWSISESNDVMLVTTPYKEISVDNQGSETAENLFMVGLGDYDVELGTKKRGWPFQRYQTWPTFRSTWGRRQGSNNVLFPQNKFKTTRQTLISTLYWHSWRH